jgi:hypothetical protein
MLTRRMILWSGALLALGVPSMALPGCGGGQGTGPGGEVKIEPPVNPAPGVVPIEEESSPTNPALKEQQKK